MEDFDEAEEQNEEDLLDLGDSFGNIDLKEHVLQALEASNKEYLQYCVKHLT